MTANRGPEMRPPSETTVSIRPISWNWLWFTRPLALDSGHVAQIDLRPVRITRNPVRRSVQLLSGLALYGTSVAMLTRAHLGLEPWGVLAEGVMKHTGLTFG